MSRTETWIETGVPRVDVLRVVVRSVESVYGTFVVVRNTKILDAQTVARLEAVGFTQFGSQSHSRPGRTIDLDEMLAIFPDGSRAMAESDRLVRDIEWAPGLLVAPTPAGRAAPERPVARSTPTPAFSLSLPALAPAPKPAATEIQSPVPTTRPPAVRPVPDPPTRDEPEETVRKAPAERANDYQADYRPASRLGTATAKIPVALAEATEKALARLVDVHGDVDRFVADRLQWTLGELGSYLSCEQVDAVALALDRMDSGEGFLIGDQTGFGKGRTVAALARAVALQGRVAIVLTEKPNLFSDLYRDITDIGSRELFGRPFVLNDGEEILDSNAGGLIHAALDGKMVARNVRDGKVPSGTKLVLATYSQFNQKGSAKAKFLWSIADGADIILDECHNAVGDSNTSDNIAEATNLANGAIYSSATFARDARNLAAYRRLFPVSMQSSDLADILQTGGRAVAEAMSQMLAEAGAYIRREKDLSGITLRVVEDQARLPRNKALADDLSPILAEVASLARSAQEIAGLRNEEVGQDEFSFRPTKDKSGPDKSKEYWYAGNFGSRLSVIVRQFLTAIQTEFCVERCKDLLSRDIKPVIVVESTMESLMREMLADEPTAPDEVTEATEVSEIPEGPVDFRDALRLLVDRTMQVSVRHPKTKEAEKVDIVEPDLVAKAKALKERIGRFPSLPLSPIDEIIRQMSDAGYRIGEVSARGMRVVEGRYEKKQPCDRIAELAGFNNYQIDGLILTGAGSTGLSAHASEKFADQRQRCMIELQVFSNVVSRVQMFGRIDRRGQVRIPLFETLSTGLPMQTRNLAMQNRKIADLSANVTGSSSSASSIEIPDMLDAVGNEIAKDYLESHPGLAERMFIPLVLQDAETAAAELYHIDKILQRLSLLASWEQDEIFAELISAYESKMADLASRGASPRSVRDMGDGWRVVDTVMFDPPIERDGPVFGQPVSIVTIEREIERRPLSSERILEMIRAAREKRGSPDQSIHSTQITKIRANWSKILDKSLPKGFLNVDQARRSPKPNAVRDAERKLETLTSILQVVRPGVEISMKSAEGTETGVVVDVAPPSENDSLHHPGRWTVRYAVPGDEKPRTISLAGYMQEPSSRLDPPGRGEIVAPHLLDRFDRAATGKTLERRKILDGNPLRAVITARHQKWSSLVTWTSVDGVQYRSVLIPKSEQNTVALLKGRIRDPRVAQILLDAGARLWTNEEDSEKGATLTRSGSDIVLEVPGSAKLVKEFSVPEIACVTGPLMGDTQFRRAVLPASRVEALCDAIAQAGHAFHYGGRYREMVVDAIMAPAGGNEAEHARRP